ncbi:hypothetical protein G7067_07260 [Leucobacter insecticola]|uniref:Uncharacterized protein n=1 Tax=Leucobacter insecticola TaxID=2714934 RepID=A0A6G8FIF5_9MICO|nr:hypothetical protein [Leucobacter insecticola]QIM16266.1 hypothetical protein G7067_07260 [Leucobacter insecticola]
MLVIFSSIILFVWDLFFRESSGASQKWLPSKDVPGSCDRKADEESFAGGKADENNAASAAHRRTATGSYF